FLLGWVGFVGRLSAQAVLPCDSSPSLVLSVVFPRRRVQVVVRRRGRLPALVYGGRDLVRVQTIDVARRVHTGDVGLLLAVHADVAVLVKLHAEIERELHTGARALLVEEAVQLDGRAAAGRDGLELPIYAVRGLDRIVDERHACLDKPRLLLLSDSILALVGDDRHVVGEAGKLERRHGGVVGVADDDELHPARAVAVTGDAPEHAAPDVLLPAGELRPVVRDAGAEDDRAARPRSRLRHRDEALTVTRHPRNALVHERHMLVLLQLLAAHLAQFAGLDPLREAEQVAVRLVPR